MGAILGGLFLAGSADGAAPPPDPDKPSRTPANAPANDALPADWGRPSAGLQAALLRAGPVTAGGPVRFRLALRTVGSPPPDLPPVTGAFGWVLLVQKAPEGKAGWYSRRVPLAESRRLATGPAGDETVVFLDVPDLGPGPAFAASEGRALLTAYLGDTPDTGLPEPAGALADALWPGQAVAKATVCLPGLAAKAVPVTTNSLTLRVAPPPLGSLSPEARDALLARLLAQFDRDAWSGSEAHATAVALGPAVAPALAEALADRARPRHARMWLAATLADLDHPASAPALRAALADADPDIARVAAYHGPKRRDAGLDAAIVAAAAAPGRPHLTALALLGFLVHRGEAPERLVEAGLASDDARGRAAAAEALAAHRNHETVQALAALLADDSERVRGTAARLLARMDARGAKVLEALVRALDRPGETARARVCAALADLTGREGAYDVTAPEAERAAALDGWRTWWRARAGG